MKIARKLSSRATFVPMFGNFTTSQVMRPAVFADGTPGATTRVTPVSMSLAGENVVSYMQRRGVISDVSGEHVHAWMIGETLLCVDLRPIPGVAS